MGQETKQSHYTLEEEQEFCLRLREETNWLKEWIKNNSLKKSPFLCGYEIEGWIINNQALPYACSDQFLEHLDDPHVTPELSKCNFEINGNPFKVDQKLASHLEEDFYLYWKKCSDTALKKDGRILLIGTYPDLTQISFGMKQIYPRNRYYAINDRINFLRKQPVPIQIQGRDTLLLNTSNIMHEAQTTSLQIHLQVDFTQAKDFYNAALIASPVMSALCANSPYVCGKELWEESRIPLFEKVISLKSENEGRRVSRVGLGYDFVQQCVSELFEQNLSYSVLLPDLKDTKKEKIQHLLLHNGTIWRWNRPLIGFDEEGQPHFRVEHRVPSSGPTLVDMQANMFFFMGLIHFIKRQITNQKTSITFQELEEDFYRASQFGLSSEIKWLDGKIYQIKDLLLKHLISSVWEELNNLSLACSRTETLINDIIKNRVDSLQTGSAWQKNYVKKFGKKFNNLVETYWKNQQTDTPVYQWKV